MPKNSYISRKNRLDQLLGILSSGETWTAIKLSKTLEVSHRTLARDLADLEASGIAIESDRGRGGGVRLRRNWGLGKLQLSYGEIVDLLLALATMEKLGSPLLMKNLKSIRNKLSQSFPGDQKSAVEKLRKRILVAKKTSSGFGYSAYALPSSTILNSVQAAFFESTCLEISYIAENKQKTERVIEPHFLLCAWPVWYIQAWDQLRNDVRFFRLDRIVSAAKLKQKFNVRLDEKFRSHATDFFENL